MHDKLSNKAAPRQYLAISSFSFPIADITGKFEVQFESIAVIQGLFLGVKIHRK